ncbi:heavy metal-associated domain, HMA containing protein [Tanacetum coccineum]
MTINLKIVNFHNCYGCTRKVRKALRKIGGVELVAFDPENGNAIVASAELPEVIRYALEAKIKKKVILVSQEVTLPINQTFDPQGLGLDSVDITYSNIVRLDFNYRDEPPVFRPQSRGNNGFHMEDVNYEYANPQPLPQAPPRASTEPSAPPMPSSEDEVVYGYPPEHYGYSTTRNHDRDHPNGHCTIM